ncbi:polymeric immunoglobulin receptor-like isoform X2 [Hoplias malabaricus]|uniref:polymeric immunoglobulin receptor-like isoform X2 n=1 Tax=Hoplias malabaricus TaxID=27720 RepID=UPI00346204EE
MNMNLLLINIICVLTVLESVIPEALILEGRVGENLKIRCSHEFHHQNIKFFCNVQCLTEKDILIKSTTNHNPATSGRFSLSDEGSGVFIVTISSLKMSDSGTYWCGVKRGSVNSLLEVIVTVLEVLGSTTKKVFTAYVGEDVTIQCPHDDAEYFLKFFCKSECKSVSRDYIITSSTLHNPSTRGRFSLLEGSGGFTVIISNLRMSDSGTYFCGVEGLLDDFLQEVFLTVLEDKREVLDHFPASATPTPTVPGKKSYSKQGLMTPCESPP